MKSKAPGPFGKGKDNFKCEYAKETLYVSKVDYTSDKGGVQKSIVMHNQPSFIPDYPHLGYSFETKNFIIYSMVQISLQEVA